MGLEPMTSCVTGRRSNLAELTHQKISVYELNIFFVAEIAVREGFEPPEPFSPPVFKTGAIDHSAISPKIIYLYRLRSLQDSNLRPID